MPHDFFPPGGSIRRLHVSDVRLPVPACVYRSGVCPSYDSRLTVGSYTIKNDKDLFRQPSHKYIVQKTQCTVIDSAPITGFIFHTLETAK